ncbi:uncharacterized protein FIBRA_08565 [Fibroporia radiculosa]|uniref:Uncharacterized protein n=1 Tax=Fibroporia radiculosa TaxID=599839 RepID=J4GHQ4_9APHY|nr:uncharacterized protein FIBRA_08565 [Fibroporia radiculosa]CCM06313.1 predicted protein [Fibroporia radiculosa]
MTVGVVSPDSAPLADVSRPRVRAFSQNSCKSTSSLGERIIALLPMAIPSKVKARARSKLSLAVTTATADSSPSTDSMRTWSPVTPTGFAFPPHGIGPARVYTQSEYGHGHNQEFEETREDMHRIGRVLTPEPDPFAKAEIAVSKGLGEGVNTPSKRTAWDLDEMDGITGYIDPLLPRTQLVTPVSRSAARRRFPPVMDIFPQPQVSPAYTFPSSCSIYVNQDRDVFHAEGHSSPLTPTETPRLVSRFSTSSVGSGFSSRSDEDNASEIYTANEDVDVDTTFVFGSPASVHDEAETTVANFSLSEVIPTPRPRILGHATVPQPPSPQSPTRRKASVRTVASEPASSSRVTRPGSPFPLMRGVSDGTLKGRLGRSSMVTPRISWRGTQTTSDDIIRDEVEDDSKMVEDSGVWEVDIDCEDLEKKGEEDYQALEDSFVLPVVQIAQIRFREEEESEETWHDAKSACEPTSSLEMISEERLAFNVSSCSASSAHLPVPDDIYTLRPSGDSDTTLTPQRFQSSSFTAQLRRKISAELRTGKGEGPEREWDRSTVASAAFSARSSSQSSVFHSARSSIDSECAARNSI